MDEPLTVLGPVRRDRISRVTRGLGATVGVVFLMLGVAELVTHLDEPRSLFFWLPSLWGGGALVLVGVFRTSARPWLSDVLLIIGALLGLLATAWTVLMPVLLLTLVVLTIVRRTRQAPASAWHRHLKRDVV
jgi:hypothetical protein